MVPTQQTTRIRLRPRRVGHSLRCSAKLPQSGRIAPRPHIVGAVSDDRLPQIQAWFRSRGLDLLLTEAQNAGKVYAHVYGGEPRGLQGLFIGSSMLDAAEQAQAAITAGGPIPIELDASTSTSETLLISVSDVSKTSDKATVVAQASGPVRELLEAQVFSIRWEPKSGKQDDVFVARAFDSNDNMLGIAVSDNKDDILLELVEHLKPPEASS
jgi:hypothetical protein